MTLVFTYLMILRSPNMWDCLVGINEKLTFQIIYSTFFNYQFDNDELVNDNEENVMLEIYLMNNL